MNGLAPENKGSKVFKVFKGSKVGAESYGRICIILLF